MKQNTPKKTPPKPQPENNERTRTNVPGQNPQQNDAPDHDLYNDEGRPNLAKDPEDKD